MSCYRKFIALSKKQKEIFDKMVIASNEATVRPTTSPLTRSNVNSPKCTGNAKIFPKLCIICKQRRKKVNGVEQKLVKTDTDCFAHNLRKYAIWLEDEEMLATISNVDLFAKEVQYHGSCRKQYQYAAEISPKGTISKQLKQICFTSSSNTTAPVSGWQNSRNVHSDANNSLFSFVDENIIQKRQVHRIPDLKRHYKTLLYEFGGPEYEHFEITTTKFEEKLKSLFIGKVAIHPTANKRMGNIVFSSELSLAEAIANANSALISEEMKHREVAFELRKSIQQQEKRKLPADATVEDIIKGEVDIPDKLRRFVHHLVSGPANKSKSTSSKMRRVESISADIVFCATNGNKKPAKHLKLGMALKSITGSTKIGKIRNRYGHCASNDTVEELETEMT